MLTLYTYFRSSAAYRVRIALGLKGLPYDSRAVHLVKDGGQQHTSAYRALNPQALVPSLQTEDGTATLTQSLAIMEYLEEAYPQAPALLPADPFSAAKVRELITFMELHLELVARNLYPQAFFGGTVSESAREKVGAQLEKNIAAFGQLAKFSPFVAGDSFTLADCAAIVHLPLISAATKIIYGRDYLADLPVRDYLARMAERPHVQRVNADRKTSTAEMLARQPKR